MCVCMDTREDINTICMHQHQEDPAHFQRELYLPGNVPGLSTTVQRHEKGSNIMPDI